MLITGFHDWRELENNVWRCRDNPSCRLLLGDPSSSPPIKRDGPLVRALRDVAPSTDFTFVTLPVTWGTAQGLDLLGFDVVVHLGLGVYDRKDTILIECGAFNLRNTGADALAHNGTGEAIEPGSPRMIHPAALTTRYAQLARNHGPVLVAGEQPFSVEEAPARKQNSYICNETHWRALRAVEASAPSLADGEHGLRAAYFLHLPYARTGDESHEGLAKAVAVLVGRLVELEV